MAAHMPQRRALRRSALLHWVPQQQVENWDLEKDHLTIHAIARKTDSINCAVTSLQRCTVVVGDVVPRLAAQQKLQLSTKQAEAKTGFLS